MSEEPRIYPRSSAFEMLLGRVYMDLWTLQDDPAAFDRRVRTFVDGFLPSMFQEKVREKFDYDAEKSRVDDEIAGLEKVKENADPFTQERIETQDIPERHAEFAERVWHVTVDVLTEAGFNFPMAKPREFRQMR